MTTPFEYRPVSADELADFRRAVSYVFADNTAPSEDDAKNDPMQPEWSHAAFHKGQIVATSGAYPFKMRMNGRGVLADGVTAVGTNPGFRRRGLVRQMITDLLHRAHENGQETSILWASMGAIYQRFGYGHGSTNVTYNFDPRYAEFQFGERAEGYTSILEKDDGVPVIKDLYRAFIEDRNLLLHRAPVQWEIPFRGTGRKTYCVVHYNGDDEPDGFMLYGTRERTGLTAPEPGQLMEIDDFVWLDMNGYRGLWDYVRAHDLVGRVSWSPPEDDPLPHMLLEPRILQRRTFDGIWLRVVDAAATLAARGYDHAGKTTIAISEDKECPWNVGTYALETDGVQAEAQKTTSDAEISITVNGLASLLAGHTSLTQLTHIGRAEVSDNKRLPALDALFSTRYRPACMNGF